MMMLLLLMMETVLLTGWDNFLFVPVCQPWDLSVTAKGYEVLLVSQFTLYGKFKGNSLTYHQAMPPTEAKRAYEEFCQLIKSRYEEEKVFDGEFGAMMKVSLVNDGPVTITVDSSVKN
mmetsp:Transcript_19605/g.41338  ORF Transcript_19605/g.41338 Transcript_19605/m.41338 type:complete len:118 (-) Transcript_19605:1637-1990(-)